MGALGGGVGFSPDLGGFWGGFGGGFGEKMGSGEGKKKGMIFGRGFFGNWAPGEGPGGVRGRRFWVDFWS